jgi:hypothetical protein
MKNIILIFVLLFPISIFAQYECSVFNPIQGEDYILENISSSDCDNWFNANKADGYFLCNGECILSKINKSEYYAEIEAKKQIQKDIENGNNVIAHVVYLNNVRNASDAIKIAFLANAEVKQAKDLLSVGRISLARSVIANATADGEIITTALKTQILEFIDSL